MDRNNAEAISLGSLADVLFHGVIACFGFQRPHRCTQNLPGSTDIVWSMSAEEGEGAKEPAILHLVPLATTTDP